MGEDAAEAEERESGRETPLESEAEDPPRAGRGPRARGGRFRADVDVR